MEVWWRIVTLTSSSVAIIQSETPTGTVFLFKLQVQQTTACLSLTALQKNNMIHKPLPRREVSSAADLDDFSFDPECEIGVFAQCSKSAKVLSDDFTPPTLISTDDLGFSTQLEMTTDEQRIRDYCMVRRISNDSHLCEMPAFFVLPQPGLAFHLDCI